MGHPRAARGSDSSWPGSLNMCTPKGPTCPYCHQKRKHLRQGSLASDLFKPHFYTCLRQNFHVCPCQSSLALLASQAAPRSPSGVPHLVTSASPSQRVWWSSQSRTEKGEKTACMWHVLSHSLCTAIWYRAGMTMAPSGETEAPKSDEHAQGHSGFRYR